MRAYKHINRCVNQWHKHLIQITVTKEARNKDYEPRQRQNNLAFCESTQKNKIYDIRDKQCVLDMCAFKHINRRASMTCNYQMAANAKPATTKNSFLHSQIKKMPRVFFILKLVAPLIVIICVNVLRACKCTIGSR